MKEWVGSNEGITSEEVKNHSKKYRKWVDSTRQLKSDLLTKTRKINKHIIAYIIL